MTPRRGQIFGLILNKAGAERRDAAHRRRAHQPIGLTPLVKGGTIGATFNISQAYSGGIVIQRLFALALLLGVILWLVLSYIPDSLLPLPTVGYSGAGMLLAGLAVLCLAAFLAIQWIVVQSTARSLEHGDPSDTRRPPFRLNKSVELFWTALPLAMTLALAWASYALWRHWLQP